MMGSLLGILIASLLGSVHCAAMCGGFVCFYAGSSSPGPARGRDHAMYNGGRLASYLFLGALAGAMGSGVTRLGAMAGITRAATVVAGVLMVGWAIAAVAAHRGIALGGGRIPDAWKRALGGVLHRLREKPPAVRAAMMGLATTLIPCGWLYVFVAAAGATANPIDGMLVMAVFWLGTVPALVAVGVGAQSLFGPFRKRLPMLSAFTVLIIGLLALTGRLTMTLASAHGH